MLSSNWLVVVIGVIRLCIWNFLPMTVVNFKKTVEVEEKWSCMGLGCRRMVLERLAKRENNNSCVNQRALFYYLCVRSQLYLFWRLDVWSHSRGDELKILICDWSNDLVIQVLKRLQQLSTGLVHDICFLEWMWCTNWRLVGGIAKMLSAFSFIHF